LDWNIYTDVFDAVVVTISVIDLAVDNDAGGLSALQAFRLLRVARALQYVGHSVFPLPSFCHSILNRCCSLLYLHSFNSGWSGMRKLLYAIYRTLYDLFFFSLVLGMFMFVATVAGRIILGGEMQDPDDPRYS
jgi:hypothetical protein